MVRSICESYTGITPKDLGDLTYDQIWVMACDASNLERRRLATTSASEAVELGLIEVDD